MDSWAKVRLGGVGALSTCWQKPAPLKVVGPEAQTPCPLDFVDGKKSLVAAGQPPARELVETA